MFISMCFIKPANKVDLKVSKVRKWIKGYKKNEEMSVLSLWICALCRRDTGVSVMWWKIILLDTCKGNSYRSLLCFMLSSYVITSLNVVFVPAQSAQWETVIIILEGCSVKNLFSDLLVFLPQITKTWYRHEKDTGHSFLPIKKGSQLSVIALLSADVMPMCTIVEPSL